MYCIKNSYNKLNLSGEVTDWFELDMSFLKMTALEGYHDQSIYVLREIGEWYNENYGSADEYDVDNDGYIDSIWMVYDYPAKTQFHTLMLGQVLDLCMKVIIKMKIMKF